jgi:hypothetical protein
LNSKGKGSKEEGLKGGGVQRRRRFSKEEEEEEEEGKVGGQSDASS